MTRIPGDLAAEEIERRYRVALLDIRRGGSGDIARPELPQRSPAALRTQTVLATIALSDTTVGDLATRLGRDICQVWGHVCFLRKMQKVAVTAWVTSPKGRKCAVYGILHA